MVQLILKDFLVQKRERTYLIVLILCISLGAIFPSNPGFAAAQLLLAVYLLLVYANSFDYKYNAEIMINSLPVSRAEVVGAKYLSAFIYYLMIAAVAIVVRVVLNLAGFSESTSYQMLPVIHFVFLSLFFLSIYVSIFFPIYFKYGYQKARWGNFLAFFVIFGLMTLFGNISQEYANGMLTPESNLHHFAGILVGNAHLVNYILLLVLGVCFLFISHRVSIRIYQRKEF